MSNRVGKERERKPVVFVEELPDVVKREKRNVEEVKNVELPYSWNQYSLLRWLVDSVHSENEGAGDR